MLLAMFLVYTRNSMPVTNLKYQKLYQLEHNKGHFPGFQAYNNKDVIKKIIEKTGAKTLLDYGCGKARAYTEEEIHKFWNIRPYLYDPYFEPYSRKPIGRFDGVICLDVLEHIPESDIEDVLNDIFSYAKKFVLLTIDIQPAKKILDNGENAHLTVKPMEWWKELLTRLHTQPFDLKVLFCKEEERNG